MTNDTFYHNFKEYISNVEESKPLNEVNLGLGNSSKKPSDYTATAHGYNQKDKSKINNMNGEEVLQGLYCEMSNDPKLTLDMATDIVAKNLADNPLYYVENGQFGVKGLGYKQPASRKAAGNTFGGSGYGDTLEEIDNKYEIISSLTEHIILQQGLNLNMLSEAQLEKSATEVINDIYAATGMNKDK